MTTTHGEPSVIKPLAVIYLRVSTKEQAERGGEAEGFSIPAQRDACIRKAESMGAQVIAEFVDAGESARSANRPELQNMIQVVEQHKIGFVIVHKVDRLARNRADDIEINVKLRAAGAQLVSCSENIDETPSGQLMHGIMSSLAEFYSLNLSAEAKKGMLQKAKSGGTPGRAPFGYRNVIFRDNLGREVRTVETDPERATWVHWIYERYATGEWTTQMLATELRELGVMRLPTAKQPAKPIAVSQVASILANRYYVGVVPFMGAEYEGTHEGLVSEELFQTAQAVREGRAQSRDKPRVHTHYLKGSLFCGKCGEPLTFERTRNRHGNYYEYFYCIGRQHYKNGCELRAVPVALAESLVIDHWATVRLPAPTIDDIRELVVNHIATMLPSRAEERDRARQRLLDLENQSGKLMQAHYNDALSTLDLKREQGRIAVERALSERTLAQQEIEADRLHQSLSSILRLIAHPQAQYIASADQGRRDHNQSVFARIFIDDDEVVGSDLMPAFQRLLSPDLATNLDSERKSHLNRVDRTFDRLRLLEAPETAREGRMTLLSDLPSRAARTAPERHVGGFLAQERPRGGLPWEAKKPAPTLVQGSSESILVGAEGIEPPTTSL